MAGRPVNPRAGSGNTVDKGLPGRKNFARSRSPVYDRAIPANIPNYLRWTMRNEAFLGLIVTALLLLALPSPMQSQRGQPVQLPEGPGKDVVQTTCVRCHGLNLITNLGPHAGRLE